MRWSGAFWVLLSSAFACSEAGPGQDEGSAGRSAAGAAGDEGGSVAVGSSGTGGARAGAGASAGRAGDSAPTSDGDGDRDGVPDADDAFPDDPDESVDTDRDGVGDDADRSADNPLSCADSDGDGCDDCVTGRSDPAHDGSDADDDGACDACDSVPCNDQGVCTASPTGARCECAAPWSGDDCTDDADACAVADPADANPCNTDDAEASCSDQPMPAETYSCTCGPGHSFDGETSVAASGFVGDQVSAMMPTQAAGPLFATGTTAIVGPGVEWSSRNQPGLAGVDLDLAGDSFTFSLVNENPDAAFNQGLLRIEITDLQSLEAPGTAIVSVTLTTSSFPADTFDAVSFGPDSITLDVSEPNLLVPKGTTWSATFAVEVE